MLNIEAIPSGVLRDLKKRGYSDGDIEQMTPEQAFTEYCQWHGLINWGETLVKVLDALRLAGKEESDSFDADGSFAHEIYLDGRGDSY